MLFLIRAYKTVYKSVICRSLARMYGIERRRTSSRVIRVAGVGDCDLIMICTHSNSVDQRVLPVACLVDAELIECMKAGCSDCFSVFFHRYCKLAFTVAFRILRQPSEAENVVQEVFLTVFQQSNPYDPERASVQAWIAQFAHFKALQHRRRLNSREYVQLEEWVAFEQSSRQISHQSAPERAVLVEQCLLTVNARQRRTIRLVHFEGYTLTETAKILNETLANTRNHYYRGLKLLRELLSVSAPSRATRAGPDWGADVSSDRLCAAVVDTPYSELISIRTALIQPHLQTACRTARISPRLNKNSYAC